MNVFAGEEKHRILIGDKELDKEELEEYLKESKEEYGKEKVSFVQNDIEDYIINSNFNNINFQYFYDL